MSMMMAENGVNKNGDGGDKSQLCTTVESSIRECLSLLDDIERFGIIPGNAGVSSMQFFSTLMTQLQQDHSDVYESIKSATFDPQSLQSWEQKCHALTMGLNTISDVVQKGIEGVKSMQNDQQQHSSYHSSFDESVWTAVGSISFTNDSHYKNNSQEKQSINNESQIDSFELHRLYNTITNPEYNFIARLLSNMLYLRVSTRTSVCRFFHLLLSISFPSPSISQTQPSTMSLQPSSTNGPPSPASPPSRQSFRPALSYIFNDSTLCSILVDNLHDLRLALSSCAIIDALIRSIHSDDTVASDNLVKHLFMDFDLPILLLNVLSSPSLEARNAALGALRRCLLNTRSAGPDFIHSKYSTFFDTLDQKLMKTDDITIKRPVIKLLFDVLCERVYLKVMLQYVNDLSRLNTLLQVFLGPNDSTSFESFHLLKLFVRNPRKSIAIENGLSQRRNDLLLRLSGLHRVPCEGSIDAFNQDRKVIIEALVKIPLFQQQPQ